VLLLVSSVITIIYFVSAKAHDVVQPDGSIRKGYLWQAYNPCSWPNIVSADDKLLEKIYEQRVLWQSLGHISKRKYPAQIFITWSGMSYDNGPDILNGM
jgi:hypothetical protein